MISFWILKECMLSFRVAELEVKKETITQIKTHGPISGGNKHSDDESSSDSDVDPEELLSWRKKC